MMLSQDVHPCTTQDYVSLDTVFTTLKPEIERAAWSLARRVFSLALDVDDLMQEAYAAIIEASSRFDSSKVKDTRSVNGWYMRRARGAMVDFIRRQFRQVQSTSLEEWEEGYGEDARRRELEARPASQPLESSPATRAAILAALETLSERQRAAVMASYMIEDTRGNCAAPTDVQERLKLTRGSFDDARRQALKKLALVL